MKNNETILDKPIGGLFLMIIFTLIWTILAEYFFDNADYRMIGVVFGIVIAYFIYIYSTFNKEKINFPKIEQLKNPKKERLFWIIFLIEGVAIFLTINFLTNFKKENLLISCIALVVGLHFIPLAKVFETKFHFYIGIWMTTSAIIALVLIVQNQYDYKIINAFLSTSCAISTTICGLNLINNGKKYIKNHCCPIKNIFNY